LQQQPRVSPGITVELFQDRPIEIPEAAASLHQLERLIKIQGE
jgi:hypothetical protein